MEISKHLVDSATSDESRIHSTMQCKKRGLMMEDVGRSLEHLVQVLQTDNSMVDHLRDKYQRSEREKQSLIVSVEMLKMRLVEMKGRFKVCVFRRLDKKRPQRDT